MPKVVFTAPNGTIHEVEVAEGRNLMQAALDNAVPGILGDCGGVCSCATCHGYIDEEYLAKLPPCGETETYMLEAVLELRANSRLCCQIPMRAELDGIRIQLPDEQM